RFELPDGLTDRRDAHAELAGEILEPERRPRRELAHDDRLAQALERRLGHRPMADCGSGTNWQRRPQRADPEAHLIRCQTRESIAARRVAASAAPERSEDESHYAGACRACARR